MPFEHQCARADLRKVVPTTKLSKEQGPLGPQCQHTACRGTAACQWVSLLQHSLVPGCCLQGDCRDLSLERKYLVFGILSKCETD